MLGSHTNASNDLRLLSIRVQTSLYGTVVPMGFGLNRVTGRLIYAGNFNQFNTGGKSAKVSNKTGSTSSYDYKTDLIVALCQGYTVDVTGNTRLCQDIERVWYNSLEYATNLQTQPIVSVSDGHGNAVITPSQAALLLNLYGVGYSAGYSHTVNDYGSPGSTTYSGNQNVPLTPVLGWVANATYAIGTLIFDGTNYQVVTTPGVSGSTTPSWNHSGGTTTDGTVAWHDDGTTNPANYYRLNSDGTITLNSATIGNTYYVTYSYYLAPNQANSGSPIAGFSLEFHPGSFAQEPWSGLPAQYSLGYSGLAYLAGTQFDLGNSGTLGNLTVETVLPLCQQTSTGSGFAVIGANPIEVINAILIDPEQGADFGVNLIGDQTQASNWCLANSVLISPVLEQQKKAADWIKEFLTIANTAPVWSDAVLKFRPYGDVSAFGNNVVFTPDTQPIYDLDDSDIVTKSKYGEHGQDDPITCTRRAQMDADNYIEIEFEDRNGAYNKVPWPAKAQWAIDRYGLRRPGVTSLTGICDQVTANTVGNIALKNSLYKRNQDAFSLPWYYILLEPMDMLTLTSGYADYDHEPLRITEISEDEKFELSIKLEQFPWGTATATLYPKQTQGAYAPGYFSTPGSINPPVFFEPPTELTQGVGEVWIMLSGGPNWGGANVWMSQDGGTTYFPTAQVIGKSATGSLTAAYATHPDPDTVDTLSVDVTESLTEIPSYTQNYADSFLSLVLVDKELMSYTTATLVGGGNGFHYDLTTYIRRGVYGTTITPHLHGARFAAVNGREAQIQYPSIGVTLWFKFTSFNTANMNEEDLASVVAYPYYVTGNTTRAPYPPNGGAPNAGASGLVWQDPLYPVGKFAMTPSSEPDQSGNIVFGMEIEPVVPATSFSTLIGGIVLNPVTSSASTGAVISSAITTSSTPDIYGHYPIHLPTSSYSGPDFRFNRVGDHINIAGTEYVFATLTDLLHAAVLTNPGTHTNESGALGIAGNQTLYFAMSEIDSAGAFTDLSNVVQVVIPATTNTNSVTLTLETFDSTAATYNLYWGYTPFTLQYLGGVTPVTSAGVTTVTFSAPHNPSGTAYGMPDSIFDHFNAQWVGLALPGSFTGTVVMVGGGGVLTLQDLNGNAFTWTTADLTTRFLSSIQQGANNPVPLQDCVIEANTATQVTVFAPAAPSTWDGPAPSFASGDVVIVRFAPTTFTGLTIGDSLLSYQNGGAGMVTDAYVGDVVRAFWQDGFNQTAFVASNTGTVFTLQSPIGQHNGLNPTWFWVENSPFGAAVTDSAADVAQYVATGTGGIFVPLPNQVGFYAVLLFASDANGNLSDPSYSPIRDFYWQGQYGVTANVSGTATIVEGVTNINIDGTSAPFTVTLPDPSTFLGDITLTRVENPLNSATVTVVASTGAELDTGVTSIALIGTGQRSVTIRKVN